MASNDSDVSKSLPSTSAMPSTSTGSSASTSHRSCPRCARRMSSFKFDKHSTCVKCRDKQCSVEIRCSECESLSVDFMLGYVKHQRSLVLKGGKSKSFFFFLSFETAGSYLHDHPPPPPPPALPSSTEVQPKSLVQSFLSDFFSQSGQIGTNPLILAPLAVPNSVSLFRETAGGLSAAPLTESPGEVLPVTQVDLPPPVISMQDVSVSSGGSPYPGRGHSVRHDMTDQLRVSGVSYEPSLPPLSALSPTSFLFPSSDFGFVSLYSSSASLSSRPPSCAFSSFTRLSSSTSVSSFPPPPLSYPPRPFVLSPAAGVSPLLLLLVFLLFPLPLP